MQPGPSTAARGPGAKGAADLRFLAVTRTRRVSIGRPDELLEGADTEIAH